MGIFFTILLLFGVNSLVAGQAEQDSIMPTSMTPMQLKNYRQYIWDSVPAAVGWVNDYGLLFENGQEDSLEKNIARFENKTSVEIMIVTMDSFMVDRKQFDELAYRLMKIWGIGKITKSNGMVICISRDEKKIHICADFGIDRFMNKKEKQRIINKYFIPLYKENKYYEGTCTGLNAIQDKIDRSWKRYNMKTKRSW